MSREYDVTALGELLIDFTENGKSEQGNIIFEANPGGAPCNVLAMLSKLGKKTSFIGKVGNDRFGNLLENSIKEQGIDSSALVKDDKVHTTLAFVHKLPDGDRDFSFYRSPGADMVLRMDEVDEEKIRNSKIFHFGSLSMTSQPVKAATRKAVEIAKESGCIISFDPNLRKPLWSSLDYARREIEYGLENCQILKISDNEIQWFTGEDDFQKCMDILEKRYPNINLLCLSMGKDGSFASYKGFRFKVPAFINENTIETTGAGDTFGACILNYVLENGISDLNVGQLRDMLIFANAAASIVTTRKGALSVMPSREDVENFIASRK